MLATDKTQFRAQTSQWHLPNFKNFIFCFAFLCVHFSLGFYGRKVIGIDSDAGRDWGQEGKGTTENEMAGWHHWLDVRESGWTPGVGDGQGGLACCDSWGCKELDTTERLIWSEPTYSLIFYAKGFMWQSLPQKMQWKCHCTSLALTRSHMVHEDQRIGKWDMLMA